MSNHPVNYEALTGRFTCYQKYIPENSNGGIFTDVTFETEDRTEISIKCLVAGSQLAARVRGAESGIFLFTKSNAKFGGINKLWYTTLDFTTVVGFKETLESTLLLDDAAIALTNDQKGNAMVTQFQSFTVALFLCVFGIGLVFAPIWLWLFVSTFFSEDLIDQHEFYNKLRNDGLLTT
jgi:hypothetical protein